jgi:hypothetical protein
MEVKMRENLRGYYPVPQDEVSVLWDRCLFAFDANVFLDLYRYSPNTRDELIEILTQIAANIWVPHQVVLEYLRNRPDVIWTQVSMYEKAKSILQQLCDQAKEETEKKLTFKNHPFIDKQAFLTHIEESLAKVEKKLDQHMQDYPQYLSNDGILDTVNNLLHEKVGPPYTQERLEEICEEGKKRYDPNVFPGEVPPGYEDAKGPNEKKGFEKYGDLILWFQLIDKAQQEKRPIIFVTNDTKEDWWWTAKGRTVGPRPELVDEMMQKAGVEFYMYNSDRFMNYARKYLEIDVEQEAIDEVKDIIREDTDQRERILREAIEALERGRRRSGLPIDSRYYDIERAVVRRADEPSLPDNLMEDEEIPF